MLSILILVVIIIFLAFISSCIPLGNENSTVRRLPWITFAIMAVNAIIYFATLPIVGGQNLEAIKVGTELEQFISKHEEILADDKVREKLIEIGFLHKSEAEIIEGRIKSNPEVENAYKQWLRTSDADSLREEFDKYFTAYKNTLEATLIYQYGLSPNGKWHLHQLITAAFLHGGLEHLLGNLLFFFAIAFSLEDLWGRSTFLGFYLMGAMASCLPIIIHPLSVPSIGASGAISATMGAFLIRLPRAKIKLLFWPNWWLGFLIGRKRLLFMMPGYLFLGAYFIEQIILWYFDQKSGGKSHVGYSVHIAGFVFGIAFAALMKATRTEETYINPKIEAKISFSAAPVVTQSLQLLDSGQAMMAERKLRTHLMKEPNSVETIMALIQVYQRSENYDQLNSMYTRLIRHHLTNQDREAALYAYDNLLSSFPDDNIAVCIPARDWLAICEYLHESEMNKEAAVEYERLVKACPDDPMASRAAVQGGEVAMSVHDNERAMRLFKAAQSLSPPQPLVPRIEDGISKCELRLQNTARWADKHTAKRPEPPKRETPKPPPASSQDLEQIKLQW